MDKGGFSKHVEDSERKRRLQINCPSLSLFPGARIAASLNWRMAQAFYLELVFSHLSLVMMIVMLSYDDMIVIKNKRPHVGHFPQDGENDQNGS